MTFALSRTIFLLSIEKLRTYYFDEWVQTRFIAESDFERLYSFCFGGVEI